MDWFESIREKVETLCVEIDDRLHQEAKHVEGQVQIVGLNVNKFFAEVIQDFLPLSHNTAPVEENDVLKKRDPEHKESTTSNEESREITDTDQPSSNTTEEFLPARCDSHVKELTQYNASKEPTDKHKSVTVKDEPCFSSEVTPLTKFHHVDSRDLIKEEVGFDVSVKEGGESVNVEPLSPLDGSDIVSFLEYMSASSVFNELSEIKPTGSGGVPKRGIDVRASLGLRCDAIDVESPEENSEPRLSPPTIILQTAAAGSMDVGSSSLLCTNKEEKEGDDFDTVKLGESCMVVDSKDAFIHSSSKTCSKSFKKKLKNALMSRLRSTAQREYEQLAILYDDDAMSEKTYIPAKELDLMKSAHELAEFDWELV
ncbi:hypothetical protein ACHQM5_018457 [Ranunculus cassubicifolius]